MIFPRSLAIALVGLVLTGCGGRAAPPRPAVAPDTEFIQAMNAGRSAFDRGQATQAVMQYERALRRAEGRDDSADIADAAYNLAVAQLADGRADRAADLLAMAERELDRSGKPAADVRVLRATALRKAGRLADSESLARVVADDISTTPAVRALAWVAIGEAALEAGEPPRAKAAMERAQRESVNLPPTSGAVAAVAGLDARIAECTEPADKAAGLHDRHADLLRRAGFYTDMADAMAAAGRSYAKAGDDRQAADRLYRAARAMAAQGRETIARDAAAGAVRSAERATDGVLLPQAKALLLRLGGPATKQ